MNGNSGSGPSAMDTNAPHRSPNTGPLDVLVVDDDPDLVSGVARNLKILGHTVRTATSGHEALGLAEQRRPHVALVDMKMPEMNGFELVRLLRQGDPVVTVIYMTGFSEMAHLAVEQGVTVLNKPFHQQELNDLLAAVSNAMSPP